MKGFGIRFSLFFLSLISFALPGCSTGPKKEEHSIGRIFLYNLHLRRPTTVGASPSAEYWEPEFRSNPKPDAKWDCENLEWLYREMDLAAVRTCLLSIGKEELPVDEKSKVKPIRGLSYVLRRETAPYLELDDPEKLPQCLRDHLGKIPVPREIFFQSNEEGDLNCYNARIPLVSEELLGIKGALHHLRVELPVPIETKMETKDDLRMLLATWSLSPFFAEKENRIFSKIVPTDICRACLGTQNVLLSTDPLPPLWP